MREISKNLAADYEGCRRCCTSTRRGVRKGIWLESGDQKERGLIDMCLVETSKDRVVGATKGLGGDGFSGVQGNHTEWCWYSKNGLILSELQEVSGTKWMQMDILAGV